MDKSKVVLVVILVGFSVLSSFTPVPDVSHFVALYAAKPVFSALLGVVIASYIFHGLRKVQPLKSFHTLRRILTRPEEPPLVRASSSQLADQLHDTALQTLVVAGHLARKYSGGDQGLTEYLEAAYHQTENVILRARTPALREEGLGAACGQLAETMERRDNLKIIWRWELPTYYKLSHPAASLIYRSLLETALHLAENTSADHFTAHIEKDGDDLNFRLISAALPEEELAVPRTGLEITASHAATLGWSITTQSKGLHLVVEGSLPHTWIYRQVIFAGSPTATLPLPVQPQPRELPAGVNQ